MAFLFGAFLGLVVGVAVVMAFARFENSRAEQRRELAATAAAFSKLTVQDLRKLIPPEFYPSWVSFTQKQKLKWLNQELTKIWPFVNEAASELIKTSVEPIFEQYKSFILASLHFSKLTLGTVAPQFTGVSILESDDSAIIMELELQWDGNPNIVLDIQTTLGISLPVQVKNIGFTGVLRLIFKPLVSEFPCFGAVCCSLREKSKVEFTLKVIGGEMTAIPGISDAIEGTIRDTIEDTLTWPNRIIVPIVPGDYSDLELKPTGVLEVKLVEARDLKNKDLVGKSDPFALIYIRPLHDKTKKSKTINNDLNPIWNEHYEFVVEDISTQHLTVKIYDDEGLQSSEIIGCARVDLADIQPGKVKDLWLDLVKDLEIQRDKKPRGQVHLELLYYPYAKHEGVPNPFANQIQLTSLEKVLKTESNGYDINQRKNVIMRGVLSVTVISAEELPPMDIGGKADPFVVLYLKKGETKKKTRVVTDTLNPIWNQTFDFMVEDALHDLLMVEVWDHDTFGKDYIGRCILTLTRVILEGEFQDTFVLQGAKSGKLNLHFKWTPQPIYRDRDRDQ
ncbi:lipid binding protein [Zea mays]|uniref:Lipid binding protein n=2 Tax=Zea mays TaxID=4577 RepID=B4F9J2_MAIZE|nr:lipid binding protein [Zea mays]ACF78785.1 unknown [Zea mays]ACG41770.1 lipid binding protein [Zea mays]ONM25599.1 Synaptotagmin-5 [Zea mays]|eukprot:NP_001130533.1 lipid binding protein [Zea mays]